MPRAKASEPNAPRAKTEPLTEPLLREIGALSSRVLLSEAQLERLFPAYAQALVGTTYAERFSLLGTAFVGGRTAVFRALDKKSGEMVALKLTRNAAPPPLPSSPPHENVLAVSSRGTSEDGLVYEVMELLEGCTIRQLLSEGRALRVPQSLAIVGALARGLAHLHAHRVLHRDVKPENLFLHAPLGRPLTLKLIDPGLMIRYRGSCRDEGTIAGSPGYVAPERLARRSYDDASDLYAVGVVLAELLGGRVPPRGPPTLPHFETLTDAPAFLESLCGSLLSEVPTERPSAPQVVRLIELYAPLALGALPPPPAPPSPEKAERETLESVEHPPLSRIRAPLSKS